jgi:radical SAM superfamily enzyme YgiQ (UPF0313 family)
MKILMAYPNLPLMYAPAISVGLFNAICKQEGVEFKLFETTGYAEEYKNRHILMHQSGANRGVSQSHRDEDYFIIKDPKDIIPDFVKSVTEYNPDLILIHFQEDVVQMGLNMLQSIEHLNIPHIAGGVYALSVPELLIKEPLIKMICRYEGENVVRGAINAFRNNQPFTSIDGVWWKDGERVRKNKPCELVDITKVIPDWGVYQKKRFQRPIGGHHFDVSIPMETYRGCPYQCSYCNSPGTRDISKILKTGNYMRRKPADIIEKELLWYIDQGYDLQHVMFIDDSFLARPKKEIFEFCKMWSKYKIPFWFNTRIENCEPDILEALKEAGVHRMTFGIESGNEEYRTKILKRPVKNSVYYKYFDIINESDIPYSLNVIIAMPYETREMIMDTARMVNRARGYDGLTLAIWQPYRGTELRTIAEEAGFVKKDDMTAGTGFLDLTGNFSIKMPKPYIQPEEATNLVRTFALYAYYPESQWHLVKQAETNVDVYNKLMADYRSKFFPGNYEIGGKTRKTCLKHDASSTYQWQEIDKVA